MSPLVFLSENNSISIRSMDLQLLLNSISIYLISQNRKKWIRLAVELIFRLKLNYDLHHDTCQN